MVARAVSAPRATVEDARATAWVQLLRYQPERGEHLLAWLFVVARMEAIRLVASRTAEPVAPGGDGAFARIADESEHLAPRLEALAALLERQRYYLSRFVAGASYEEIMEEFEVTYTTSTSLLRSARVNLRGY